MSKNSKGKNTKREVESSEEFHGGYWNATSTRDIKDSQNQLIGHKKTLKFYAYKDKKKIRKEADPTAYIMHEYYLPSDHTVSSFVLIVLSFKLYIYIYLKIFLRNFFSSVSGFNSLSN